MFGTNPILSQQTFYGTPSASAAINPLNIAYGVDNNFLFGACISITSILEKNKNSYFAFHIFSDYVDDEICLKLKDLATKYNTTITIYKINNDCFNIFPYNVRFSYATYYRFIICEYLMSYTDRLVYLDADIVCKGNVASLLNLDMQGNIIAAVADVEMMQRRAVKEFGFEPNAYFNAGMLYIDLNAWRENKILQQIIDLFSDKEMAARLTFLDQDALNLLVKGKVKIIDRKYNTFYNFDDEPKIKRADRYKEIINDDTVFIHYVGVTKPWFQWAKDYPAVKYFSEIYKISPWRDQPLYDARTLKQFKKKSVHQKYLGYRLEGFKTWLTYTWMKMKK